MELRVAQIRKQKGLTQKQLAEACSTTQQQIAKIEIGNGDPQLSTLKKIALALGCETKDLLYSKDEFLSEIRAVAKRKKLDLRKISIIELNSVCYLEANTPALHPYWEFVKIKNDKILLKEES